MTENKAAVSNSEYGSEDNLLSLQQVLRRVPVARSTLYCWISQSRFPRPVQLGPRRVAWSKRLIDAWIAEKTNQGEQTDVQ